MGSSSPIRVLVLGASGMLGHKLIQVLSASGEIDLHAAARRSLPVEALPPRITMHEAPDLGAGAEAVLRLVQAAAPDVIVNAVGAIKQRDLYSQTDDTYYINGVLPHLLAQLASSRDARVIHFSTDCVFRGDRGNYTEDDKPDVEDLYGRSKAIGEIDYGRHLTIRTSIVGFELSGHHGLLGWFLRQPRGSTLRGYTRAIFSGLPTIRLAQQVRGLIVQRNALHGLYHVASEPIAKFTLLAMINDALHLGHTLEPSDEPQIDRSLDDSRFRSATHSRRPGWSELVADLANDFSSGLYPRIYEQVYV
jgi:dTDP-4-dehydrorhamnose reductase